MQRRLSRGLQGASRNTKLVLKLEADLIMYGTYKHHASNSQCKNTHACPCLDNPQSVIVSCPTLFRVQLRPAVA